MECGLANRLPWLIMGNRRRPAHFSGQRKQARGFKPMVTKGRNSKPDGAIGTDVEFMRQAIRLARIARERGDSPVGSVVVSNGRIIAEGIEAVRAEKDLTAHAEVRALREACRVLNSLDLAGCTLYTTVEPCIMCSYVVRRARIARTVIGRAAPHVGGLSSKYPILVDSNISGWSSPPVVITGVLEEECSALFKP